MIRRSTLSYKQEGHIDALQATERAETTKV